MLVKQFIAAIQCFVKSLKNGWPCSPKIMLYFVHKSDRFSSCAPSSSSWRISPWAFQIALEYPVFWLFSSNKSTVQTVKYCFRRSSIHKADYYGKTARNFNKAVKCFRFLLKFYCFGLATTLFSKESAELNTEGCDRKLGKIWTDINLSTKLHQSSRGSKWLQERNVGASCTGRRRRSGRSPKPLANRPYRNLVKICPE